MFKVLVKRLVLVIFELIGEAQTCSVSKQSVCHNLHLMQYIIEGVVRKASMSGAQISLDLSKAFDRVGHQYLAAILRVASFLNTLWWHLLSGQGQWPPVPCTCPAFSACVVKLRVTPTENGGIEWFSAREACQHMQMSP